MKKILFPIVLKDKKLYIGKFLIAWYFFNSLKPKDSKKYYKVVSIAGIPKLKNNEFETEEECKVVCMSVAEKFISLLLEGKT